MLNNSNNNDKISSDDNSNHVKKDATQIDDISELSAKKKISFNLKNSIDKSINNNGKDNNPNDKNKFLFIRKINLKEKQNKYYTKGVFEIFNNKNLFLENKYKGKKIVLASSGKKKQNEIKLRKEHRSFTKKRIFKSNLDSMTYKYILNNVSDKNNIIDIQSKSDQTKLIRNTRKSSLFNGQQQNTSGSFILYNIHGSKKCASNFDYSFRNQKNMYGKRYPLLYASQNNNITDSELKEIYQECINRQEKNKQKEIENKKKNQIFSSSFCCNLPNMLNLQEKILNDQKNFDKENKKIYYKILNNTSKHIEKDLLMKQLQNFRIKKEKFEGSDSKKNLQYQIKWVTNLRRYNNQIISKNNFNKKQNLTYWDALSDISPLYPNLLLDYQNYKEKIRGDECYEDKKCDKHLIKNKTSINFYKGLDIKGKKLIDSEIELSKELEGKKKILIKSVYKKEETSSKIFAKSNSCHKFDFPKTVYNTMNVHLVSNILNS